MVPGRLFLPKFILIFFIFLNIVDAVIASFVILIFLIITIDVLVGSVEVPLVLFVVNRNQRTAKVGGQPVNPNSMTKNGVGWVCRKHRR